MNNLFEQKLFKGLMIGVVFIMIIGLGLIIKNNSNISTIETLSGNEVSPEEFISFYGLKVTGNAEKFDVKIPSKWDVKAGDYPVGLYWELANEFSKDAGLDITKLKGKTIKAWRFALADGLPGLNEQSKFNYPSTLVLLVDSNKVLGSWLNFNTLTIGPSVKKRYLTDITGLTFEEWIYKKGLFSISEKNSDLVSLFPVDLLQAYFKAIRDGDKTRAYACLSPIEMLGSLTMNFRGKGLYNENFNQNNSQVENIIEPKLLSFQLLDKNNPGTEIKKVGNKSSIEIAVTMKIKWRDKVFNSPNGEEVRFAILNKYKNGWKLDGFGTGP